ncbi:purine and uridine phosphorylase [Zopfia rhizophila CBS 207.26]|uniref:Purine and uridine phosphorylase n=1 Tax=Zopfia rhizophila CBS 207.26 TaxID=1314779 RepID=A0A6A6ENY7_9PEZI|nr:purine and uridine phosphorylase [Zopfia rhizophila CBS 207.26]
MTQRCLPATEYTVGWVCALPVELAAAQEMLDEEHEELPQDNLDSNLYTLGRIGNHNVVLTCLPAGHIGISPAAAGSLNAPPKVLLNAVSKLRANQYRGRSCLATHLSIFDRLPCFSRNTAGPDDLFEATYNHGGGATCEQCSKERVIQRTPRGAQEEVTIHYGTIASGNQVMRDGATRDWLSAKLGGVLCFEMEAAGLMNDFPCLVIRGICDYADSHKNKAWQPYAAATAAATAAACAKEVLSIIPAAEVAKTEVVGEFRKYHIPFSLKGVPVGKFADRPQDTEALERALLPQKQNRRRRILVVHGLGGVGKTQLAAEFARRHQHNFTSVLWLDGSSGSSLKQSIAACASRVPAGQVAETSRMYTSGQDGDLDAVVKDVLRWLSIPDNCDWLVVVDNVDRDYRRREEDPDAYDVHDYLPEADHGSVLITTRLTPLGQLGERWEVKKVDEERARAIFKTWYGRGVGQGESDELLGLLDGLPLALAQAAAYMSETGTSFGTYARLYEEQWRGLMEPQDGRHMPLRSYSNAIRTRNEAAANLLLLWAHLDNKSLWHGLLAAASRQSNVATERTSAWLREIAYNEMEFIKAIRILRSYSLVEEMEDQTGYATHPVVHQWALHIQDDSQRAELSCGSFLMQSAARKGLRGL